MIQLENICKQYTNHNHTVHAVDDVSFSVAANERVGIAGGSGSGKSTLLKLIAMLEKPTSGTLRLFGEDVTSIQNHRDIYRSMQMMFQNPLAIIPPRMNLEAFLLEPYINYGLMDVASAKDDIRKWIQRCRPTRNYCSEISSRSQWWSTTTCCIGTDYVDESQTSTL